MSVSVKNVVGIASMCQLLKIFIYIIAHVKHFVMYENGSIVKN